MHTLFSDRDFRAASQAPSPRHFWLLMLTVALFAPGCRNGWPFQTAQTSSSKEKEAVAKGDTDGRTKGGQASQDGDAFAAADPPVHMPADDAAVQVAYHAAQDESKSSASPAPKSQGEKPPTSENKSATPERLAASTATIVKGNQASSPPVPVNATATSFPAALASDAWVQAPIVASAKPADRRYAWRHAGLEPIFAQKPGERAGLSELLDDKSPVVAANAAIVMGRWGGSASAKAVPRLVATARQTEFKMAVRGAAVEALMTVPAETALPVTRQLIDDLGNPSGAPHSFTPELHGALLKVLVRHVPAEPEPRFAAALKSPSADVRLEAIRAYLTSLALHGPQNYVASPLPKAAMTLCEDGDPRVRIAAIEILAAYREPRAQEAIKRALDDYELPVRLAAIAALGQIGGDESRATLEKLSKHPSELKRAAVVSSLAAMGAHDALLEAAKDKSSHVRQAVAQALAIIPQGAKELQKQTNALARDLLHDVSGDVQRRTVKAIAGWPLEEAGPALLTAIEEGGYLARRDAAEQLAELWPAAEGFPVSATPEKRAEALAELRTKWIEQYGEIEGALARSAIAKAEARLGISAERISDLERLLAPLASTETSASARQKTVEALKLYGPDLLLALEQYSAESGNPLPLEIYRDVLPELGPAFAALDQLAGAKPTERRTAAEKLVSQAAGKQLSPLVVARLVQILPGESDPGVWQSVLAATANDASADALQLARMAIGNPTVEVRRRACEYLSLHGSIDNTPLLLPLLADPNTAIVVAAVRALAASGAIDDSAPLVELLASPDKHVRIEVAITLGKLRCPEGVPALERLAHESEWQIRQRAATALGDCGDESTVPRLIELVEDRIEVQLAAMRSLAKIVGQDLGRAGGDSPTPNEQARLWQRWFRNQDDKHDDAGETEHSEVMVRFLEKEN